MAPPLSDMPQDDPVRVHVDTDIGGDMVDILNSRHFGIAAASERVRRFVESWRKTKPPPPVRRILTGPQILCWLLLRRRSELDNAECVLLTDLCRRSSELATSRRLAQRFMVLVRERRRTHSETGLATFKHRPAGTARIQPESPP